MPVTSRQANLELLREAAHPLRSLNGDQATADPLRAMEDYEMISLTTRPCTSVRRKSRPS
jgi:hypothetical protein